MSGSNRNQRGGIWKKTPRENVLAASSSSRDTPSIRPSNSFTERLLRDCLKPRHREKLILDEETARLSESDKGMQNKTVAGDSFSTPPRRSWDSRHYQPQDHQSLSDSARITPPRNAYSQRKDYGNRVASATPPLIPHLSAREFVGENIENMTFRSSDVRPRKLRFAANSARTATANHYGYRYSGGIATPPSIPYLKDRNQLVESTKNTPLRSSKVRSRAFAANGARTSSQRMKYFRSRTFELDRVRTPSLRANATIPSRPKNQKPKNSEDSKLITPHTTKDGRHQQGSDPFVTQPFSSSPFSSFQEEREQALRDYKVTIEYKHLKSHAPGGVYLIPSMESLRNFHGIIFVRRGPFTNGIFKFKLDLPAKYNDTNMWPKITFVSKVYNPYVDQKTGELDVQSAYPTWDPSRHYLVTVLTFLKKIFYSKNFADAKANPAARELAETNPAAYKKKVEACVHESQKKVYVNEKDSTAKFTEEEVAHRVLRDLLKHHIRNENQVTKQTILAQIEKSRKV